MQFYFGNNIETYVAGLHRFKLSSVHNLKLVIRQYNDYISSVALSDEMKGHID
jgi:hypothetical protein